MYGSKPRRKFIARTVTSAARAAPCNQTTKGFSELQKLDGDRYNWIQGKRVLSTLLE